jgi:hypothetical protein
MLIAVGCSALFSGPFDSAGLNNNNNMPFSDEYWGRSLDRARSVKCMLWSMSKNPDTTFSQEKARVDKLSNNLPEHCDVCGQGLVAYDRYGAVIHGKHYSLCGRICSNILRSKYKFAYKVIRITFGYIDRILRIFDCYR